MRAEAADAGEAVQQTLQGMARSVTAGDLQKWQRLWHPEARQFAPNAPAALGRENLFFGARAWLEEWTHDMSLRCDEVRVAGNWAFASGSLTLRSVSRRGHRARILTGKFLAVLADRGDGHWLMYRYCYNSSIPLADGQ